LAEETCDISVLSWCQGRNRAFRRGESRLHVKASNVDRLLSVQSLTARIRREAKQRHETRARHPIPTWQGWLEAEAARGNEEALEALRGRARRRELAGFLL